MKTLRDYLEKQVFFLFVASELFFTASIMGIDIAEHADLISKTPFSQLAFYYLSLFTILITLLIPVTAGLSHLITFALMKKRGEVTGLFTSGFTLCDLLKFTARLRVILMIGAVVLFEIFVPPAMETVINFSGNGTSLKIQEARPGIFFVGDTLLFAGSVKYEKNVMENVTILFNYKKNPPDQIIASRRVTLTPGSIMVPEGIKIGDGKHLSGIVIPNRIRDVFAGRSGFFSSFANTTYELASTLASYRPEEVLWSRYTGFIILRILFIIAILSLGYSGASASLLSGAFEDQGITIAAASFLVSLLVFMGALGLTVSAISFPETLRMPVWIVALFTTIFIWKVPHALFWRILKKRPAPT